MWALLIAATTVAPSSTAKTTHTLTTPGVSVLHDDYVPFKGATDSIYFWVVIGDGGTPDRALTAGSYEMGVTVGEPAIQISTAGSYTGFFGFWWPDLLPVPIGVKESESPGPEYTFYLRAPFPNPARGPVRIRYGVGAESQVSMVVYDMNGRRVATLVQGTMKPGDYTVVWRSAPAGVYVIRYQAGSYRAQVKVIRR